jgi:hypothetical protein
LPQLLAIFAGSALSVISIVMAGRLIATQIPMPAAVRFSTGAALFSALVYLALTVHAGYWPVFAALPVLLIALRGSVASADPLPRMPVFFHTVFGAAGILLLTFALAPETQADAAGYHLRLVGDWNRLHAFGGKEGFYEALPQGMEMLFLPAFAWGGGSAAKLVHFVFLIATVPLIRELAREAGLGNVQGCAAAALFFLAPVCGVDGTSAYTDAGLVCACCSVIWLLLQWYREARPGLLICAALNAGFCYAVKPTFGWVLLCALIFVMAQRRGVKNTAIFAGVAALCTAPWLIRAYLVSGSPAGPFLSRWLPNRIMTPEGEAHLMSQYSAFRPAFSWAHAGLGYTLQGVDQGIFGPAYLLLPLGLLMLLKPGRRWLPVCAILLALPFLLNTGARFLMPSMALSAVAIVALLPRRAAIGLVLVQALATLPWALDRYDLPGDWRPGAPPLAAALRLEAEDHYLTRSIPGFAAARMIQNNTPPAAKILACTALPDAYVSRDVLTWWHSRRAQQFADAIHFAMMSQGTRARLVSWRWHEDQYRLLRLTALSDLRLVSAAMPHTEAGMASWRMYRPGETLNLTAPPGAHGADFLVWPGDQASLKTEVLPVAGPWRVPEAVEERSVCYIDLRRDATAYIRRAGYEYLVLPVEDDPFAEIGVDMVRHPAEWGVTIAGQANGIYLLKIKAALL